MTAPHFFADALAGDTVRLDAEDARHAVSVLRIRPGETITLADGRGTVVTALVADAEPGSKRQPASLVARVTERRTVERVRPDVIVYPAVPKAGKLDLVVQKLTELGVASVRPWFAARSVARWDAARAAAQTERLRAIAREAAKQSRSAWLPEVRAPEAPEPLPDPTVVLHESASVGLSDVLPADPPATIGIVVGPEGGLTDEEVEAFAARGARIAGLGPQILRAETAAIVAPALVLGLSGKLG